MKESAISRGIKMVGVGKRGSKSLSQDLALEILEDLRTGNVPLAAKGAFFAGLILKGVGPDEMLLGQAFAPGVLKDASRLVQTIAKDAPKFIQDVCIELLHGKELDRTTAYELGQFLMSDEPGDGARGIVASALRVRYETPDEYAGLLQAMQETLEQPFTTETPAGEPIVQFSEPFDGVDHSYFITPLLARFVQNLNYRVINMTGRNSGPKMGINLLDVAQNLNQVFVRRNQELSNEKPTWGWFINQPDLSRSVDRWVEIRRQTIKRPFLATLEKFLNPVRADIVVTSAFHPPYAEKMITISEQAGFPAAIVVRNGLEGTLAFPLKRPVKILCSARQAHGEYLRQEFEFDPEKFLGFTIPIEEKLDQPNAFENASLIETFTRQGKTSNELFDWRVQCSCAGLQQAIDWIQNNLKKGWD